jgi:hypothetical protein
MAKKQKRKRMHYRSEISSILRRAESGIDFLVDAYITVCANKLATSALSPSQKLRLAERGMERLVRRLDRHARRVSSHAARVRKGAK